MRLLSRSEILKMAQVVRERCKSAVAAPTITVGGDIGRINPRSTFTMTPGIENSLGPKGLGAPGKGVKSTKGLPAGGTGANT